MPIPYGRQSIDDGDVAAVSDVLRGDWLTQGPAVAAFEEAVADACDVPHAVAFSSGTAALHGAAHTCGLGAGDELVTSALTFAASANCAAYVGATPRFADIDPATWNVSAATLEPALSAATRAVVPVAFAGLPLRTREIRALVGDEVTIIEDDSHALGGHDGEAPVGACLHADMAVFSFHPVKTIAAGEGGMVTTRSADLAARLRRFRSHGITKEPGIVEWPDEGGWHQEQHVLGFNYRLSDIHSALGLSQMRRLADFVERRNAVVDTYREALADIDALELAPAAPDGALHAHHLFVVVHRGGADARRQLYDGLRERDIYAQVHYLPVYLHPYYRRVYGYERGLCPEAERYYSGCLSLPCFPTLTDIDQQRVIDAVRALA
jgi:perosamine synthetase